MKIQTNTENLKIAENNKRSGNDNLVAEITLLSRQLSVLCIRICLSLDLGQVNLGYTERLKTYHKLTMQNKMHSSTYQMRQSTSKITKIILRSSFC